MLLYVIDLFIGFHVSDLNGIDISIKQRSYIKSLFVNMLDQILGITNCVSLKPFIFAINLNVRYPLMF